MLSLRDILKEEEEGTITTDDPRHAEKMADQGYDVNLVRKGQVKEEDSKIVLTDETLEIVRLAFLNSLRVEGDEVSKKNFKIKENKIVFVLIFKSGTKKTGYFSFLDNNIQLFYNKKSEIVDNYKLQPSGEVLVSRISLEKGILDFFENSSILEIVNEAIQEALNEEVYMNKKSKEILDRFRPLRKTLVSLMTSEFYVFIKDISWIGPKPTTFRVQLENDQVFYLKWMGKNFEAQIKGKRYDLLRTPEFQQALDSLNHLFKHKIVSPDQQGAETDTSGGFEAEPAFSPSGGGGLGTLDIGEPGSELGGEEIPEPAQGAPEAGAEEVPAGEEPETIEFGEI